MPPGRRAATAPPGPGTLTEASGLDKQFGTAVVSLLEVNRGITTVGQLLDYLPRRYLEPGALTDLAGLVPGEEVVIVARIASVTSRAMKYRKGDVVTVTVTDGVSEVELTFFSKKATYPLIPGRRAFFAGRVEEFNRSVTLTHPTFEVFKSDDMSALDDYREHLIPIYSASGALQSWKVARAVQWALGSLGPLPDFLPEQIRERHGLLARDAAMRAVHRPRNHAEARAARARLR
ncbi:MAG TPA: hypothetical protein VHM65_09635, partial [Candidatus Lustribacter sp.]|nr:hypothetical protein [Candidatus Lustribacter sp.]